MAINPLNVPRVSFNLRTIALTDQLRRNSLSLFSEQQRISTGKRFLVGSEDPVAAGKIVRSNELLARQDQILANLQHADRYLIAAESAVTDVNDLLIEAKTVALEQVSSFQDADQRKASAIVIDSIIDQLLTIGNQQFAGHYLFGGQRTTEPPLDVAIGRIRFAGDVRDRNTFVDFGLERPFNVTVDRLYGLRDNEYAGFVDLNPAVSAATRLDDLRGANDAGIRDGVFRVSEVGGANVTFNVDTNGVDTLGDLAARFNGAAAAAGSSLTASLTANGLQINGGAGIQIVVQEVGQGNVAADLGLLGSGAVGAALVGGDVDPLITLTTPLSALNGGAGLTLPDGVVIQNGERVVTVDFAGATTVQDVLNRLNNANIGVRVTINDAGTGLTALNEVSGLALSIGENGGNDATALGIRTLHAGTLLSDLNGGRGVTTVTGDDLQITDANGVTFTVDLSGALTVQDALDRINTAAAGAGSTLTAGFQPVGNGILLSHPAPGAQNIVVTRANLSAAADDLGLFGTGTTQTLAGDDVRTIRSGGAIAALYALADALRANDTAAITAAGDEIDQSIRDVANQLGRLGTRSRAVADRLTRTEDAVTATRRLLSELEDVDLTEAITKFQQAQLALQANLQTGSSLLNLSLLDFLQ